MLRMFCLRICLTLAFVSLACEDTSAPSSPALAEPTWRQLAGGVGEERFVSVWGTSADSLFALGVDYPVFRMADGTWTVEPTPAGVSGLRGVWGRNQDDVFAAGAGGAIIHFDGSAWSSMSSGVGTPLNDVWGVDGPDVFVAGGGLGASGGRVLRYDGSAWSVMSSNFSYGLNAVWAADARNIMVAGEMGYIGRFDGRVWTTVSLQPYTYSWRDAWGAAANDVFLVGDGGRAARYRSGEPLAASVAPATLRGVFGFTSNDVWAVGDDGVIVHFDGAGWTRVPSGTINALRTIWGFPDGRAVALGDHGIVVGLENGQWRPVVDGRLARYNDMWGTSPTNVFAVGGIGLEDGLIHHIDGREWRFTGDEMLGVFGFSPRDVFAVGRHGAIQHFDGTDWTPMVSGTHEDVFGVVGTTYGPTNRVYAVGTRGLIRAWDGVKWTAMVPPDNLLFNLFDVWAAAPDNAFAVGDQGALYRYRGPLESIQWTRETLPVGAVPLYAVAGRRPDDVLAVTGNGRLLRFDGTRWYDVASQTTDPLLDVALADFQEGLIAGSPNTLLRQIGPGWIASRSPYAGEIRTVWSGDHIGYAAGSQGSIFEVRW